ncbi:MAG: EAL domain-containing protein [Pyrinomonadaceae bacterium]
MNNSHPLRLYTWSIIALGGAALLSFLPRLPAMGINPYFLILATLTIGFGSRTTIQIPRFKSHFAFSDTFIFLALLLYGGEAAMLLAVAEAFCSSARFCKRWFTVFFNVSVIACSMFVMVWTLRASAGDITLLAQRGATGNFITALCEMAIVYYLVNSGLASVYGALKSSQPLWRTWKTHYLWTSLTYFMGAAAAAVLAKLTHSFGPYIVLATTPVCVLIYFTYRTYTRSVEMSLEQAEQAKRHAAELQAHSAALAESEERFRSSFDYAAIGMALVEPAGGWLKVNRALSDLLGYTAEEFLKTKFQSITHDEDLGDALTKLNDLLKGKALACQMEMRYLHRHGHPVWTLCNVAAVREAGTNSLHLIFQIQDISARKRAEQQLINDALHDALTGLPNRTLFKDRLHLTIERARRDHNHQFAVMFLDLDRFKYINDSLGHLVGDQLLIEIARRLVPCLRHGDTVARLGGDEFTVLLDGLHEIGEADKIAQRIRTALAQPFHLSGHEVFTSASIGIAQSSAGYVSAEDLMRDADTAMYQAKRLGKARHETFDPAMHDLATETLALENDLRRALERDEFLLHYQPVVSLDDERIIGFEALVRWRHPQRGLIPPQKFIPLAEETGLILPIGQWVLESACGQARVWQDQFPEIPLFVSVNVSGKQLAEPSFVTHVKEALRKQQLDSSKLQLEITESAVMGNREAVLDILKQLQEIGIELSMDDFGTGYSSLSYLHYLPASTLKIDRSFVNRMGGAEKDAAIVRTIITLARNLGMAVIAEGVETGAQASLLKAMSCEFAQGYFFSRPVDAQAATAALLTHPSSPALVLLPPAAVSSDNLRQMTSKVA